MKYKLITLGLLLGLSSAYLSACDNNPFWPRAELSITEVTSTDKNKGVSILQSFKKAGQFVVAEYKFNEPVITIENKSELPRVVFKKLFVEFSLGKEKIPAQEVPVSITVPYGKNFSGTIPILGISDSILNAVYPDDSFARTSTGYAEVTLVGVDDNNNLIATKFATSVHFETNPTNAEQLFPQNTPADEAAATTDENATTTGQ